MISAMILNGGNVRKLYQFLALTCTQRLIAGNLHRTYLVDLQLCVSVFHDTFQNNFTIITTNISTKR